MRQLVFSAAGATASKLALGAFTVATARALGIGPSADFFAWAFVWMGALALLVQGTLQPTLAARLGTAEDEAARARALKAGQRIARLAGVGAALLLVACAPWAAPASASVLPLWERAGVLGGLAVTLYWVSVCSPEMAALAWAHRAGLAAGMGTLSPLASALALWAAPTTWKGVAAAGVFAVGSLLEYILLVAVRRTALRPSGPADAEAAQLLRLMVGWLVVGTAQMLMPMFDLLLAAWAGDGAVALWTYATRPASVMNAILGVGVSAALTTALAAARVQSGAALVRHTRRYALAFAGLGSALALGVSLFAPSVTRLLYGTAAMDTDVLRSTAQVMALYGWTTAFWVAGGVAARALTAEGRTSSIAAVTIAAVGVKLAVSFPLFHHFALQGLAVSVIVQAAFFSGVLFLVFERTAGATGVAVQTSRAALSQR